MWLNCGFSNCVASYRLTKPPSTRKFLYSKWLWVLHSCSCKWKWWSLCFRFLLVAATESIMIIYVTVYFENFIMRRKMSTSHTSRNFQLYSFVNSSFYYEINNHTSPLLFCAFQYQMPQGVWAMQLAQKKCPDQDFFYIFKYSTWPVGVSGNLVVKHNRVTGGKSWVPI